MELSRQEAITMKEYQLGPGRRVLNMIIGGLLRSGLAGRNYALLTVPGRVTGRPRSTPVRPLSYGGERWLVAPYGAVSWVRNARAAGEVTLTRGRRRWHGKVSECGLDESGEVLREYARLVPVTRPYFAAHVDDTAARFAAEAAAHPVFRLID
jgi:deazaflavin-dependent oxidoreductase (nitroreductase family)